MPPFNKITGNTNNFTNISSSGIKGSYLGTKSKRDSTETNASVDELPVTPSPIIKKKSKLFGLVIANNNSGIINRGKKNKKTVFYHSNKFNSNNVRLRDNEDDLLNFNKSLETTTIVKDEKTRGSKFRGVSRNGNQWQVLIMVNKKKRYVASFSNEISAAKAYDKVALQHHGLKAKTNFFYTEDLIKNIMEEPYLLVINDNL